MCTERNRNARQAGVSLVELVLFILIVSIAIGGILSVMNVTSARSANPMVRKQALAIAESLLEEITLQPFTYCDVSDANATTARYASLAPPGTPADQLPNYCAATVQGLGAGGKFRSAEPYFDNVGNYHNFAMSPIVNLAGNAVNGLDAYTANVTITAEAAGANAGDRLRIDVVVTGPGDESVELTGYRYRYSPRGVP